MRFALALALVLVGCDATPHQPDPPPEHHQDPPADALEARLRERGAELADWMIPNGDPMRGEIAEGGSRDFSQLFQPGWCYKVVAVGGEGIEELDLLLYDGHSVLVERDTNRGAEPYLGLARPICPGVNAMYRIEVRAVEGGGEIGLQVYRSL